MTRSHGGILRLRGVTALAVALVPVLIAPAARATDSGLSPPQQGLSNTGVAAPVCDSACLAQHAVAVAFREPVRLGSSRFQLRVGSSKLTIGWSLLF